MDKSYFKDFPVISLLIRITNSNKHFKISGIIFISHKNKLLEIVINISYYLINQNSNKNIIFQILINKLNYTRYSILKYTKIIIGIIFNGKYNLKKYIIFDFIVEEIHYIIHFFIQLNIKKGKGNTRMLLLGLP